MKKNESLPKETRALLLKSFSGPSGIFIGNKPLKIPTPDEVIVKLAAAPINPSDLLFLEGGYGTTQTLPWTPGFEGAGTVIHASGKWAKMLGKRVACRFQSGNDGTWAEYIVTSGSRCFPLPQSIDFFQGSSILINPLTAYGLIQKAKKFKHRAAIQTAGMSQVSQMTLKFSITQKFPILFIVRKSTHVNRLQKMGAKYVLNSEDKDFKSKLNELATQLKATVAFDAVGGDFSRVLLDALPPNGELWSYGSLSGEPCILNPMALSYQNKVVRGFWVTEWQSSLALNELKKIVKTIMKNKSTTFTTQVAKVVSPKDVPSSISIYTKDMSKGKIIINLEKWPT